MTPLASHPSAARILRQELPSPHPGIKLQILLVRCSPGGARTAPPPDSSGSRQGTQPYRYSVRAVVPAAMARRSTGLGQQDRQAFVQALREGIRQVADAEANDTSQRPSRRLWDGEHHSLTLVADDPAAVIQWEVRGFKIKLSQDHAEQLIATLEAVPELAERMIHAKETQGADRPTHRS